MSYMPDLSDESSVFIEGITRSNATNIKKVKIKKPSERLQDLIIPESKRKMPVERDKILVSEDADLVEWERVLRQFLYKLSSTRENRIAAPLIWEWATGLSIKAIANDPEQNKVYAGDLRKLNRLLRAYFGEPYSTFINNRKFNRAYKVKKNFLVYRKAPHTLSLYLEWRDGALKP